MILKDRDGKKVKITMREFTGTGYTPDWSEDFFVAGRLEKDESEADTVYLVESVPYCIDQAIDWENGRGDYADEDPEGRAVKVVSLNGPSKLNH